KAPPSRLRDPRSSGQLHAAVESGGQDDQLEGWRPGDDDADQVALCADRATRRGVHADTVLLHSLPRHAGFGEHLPHYGVARTDLAAARVRDQALHEGLVGGPCFDLARELLHVSWIAGEGAEHL